MPENHSNKFPNGYTRVPHEILNAIATSNLTAQEHRIVNLIIRTTYGCGKDYLILNNWAELSVAGIYRPDCRNNIERLESSKVIIIDWITKSIKLNPNYSQWLSQNELANSNSETYKKIISRQLCVSESLTMKKQKLANHEQESKRNANNVVSESLTATEPTSTNSLPESTSKDTLKDIVKENTHPKDIYVRNSNSNLPDDLDEDCVLKLKYILEQEKDNQDLLDEAKGLIDKFGIITKFPEYIPLKYIKDYMGEKGPVVSEKMTDAGRIKNGIIYPYNLICWLNIQETEGGVTE